MQVSVEQLEGLERRITVNIPATTVDSAVQERLASLAKDVRLDGFRPGKVPVKVVKRLYGNQVRHEIVSDLLQNSLRDALKEHGLTPLESPEVELTSMAQGEGQDLAYQAAFEVAPDFDPVDPGRLEVVEPVAEVGDADIDRTLDNLRQQHRTWRPIDRPAAGGDRVTVTFQGHLDDEALEDLKGEGMAVILGQGQVPEEFEHALQGLSSGQGNTFELTMGQDHPEAKLAGRTIRVEVTVDAVAEPELPPLDAAFAAQFGLEDATVDGLRQAVRENLEREAQQAANALVKRQILEQLVTRIELPLPRRLVEREVQTLSANARSPEETPASPEAAPPAPSEAEVLRFEPEARRRVKLGLIVSRCIRDLKLEVDERRVRDKLLQLVSDQPPDQARKMLQSYQQHPQVMEGLRSAALEDQVVEHLATAAPRRERPCSFDELMKSYTTGTPLPAESAQ